MAAWVASRAIEFESSALFNTDDSNKQCLLQVDLDANLICVSWSHHAKTRSIKRTASDWSSLKSLRHVGSKCIELLDSLDRWIDETRSRVCVRKNRANDPYRLSRQSIGEITTKSKLEERLEHSLWKIYRGSPFLPPLCTRLVSFQVLLFNRVRRDKWGKVDLMGVSATGRPVVIELKQPKGDNPLRRLVEGAAYCIAVQEAWRQGPFRSQWADKVCKDAPMQLDVIPLVSLAPTEYWRIALGDGGARRAGQVFPEHWELFHRLVGALSAHEIMPSFATFEYEDPEDHIPTVSNVRPQIIPV